MSDRIPIARNSSRIPGTKARRERREAGMRGSTKTCTSATSWALLTIGAIACSHEPATMGTSLGAGESSSDASATASAGSDTSAAPVGDDTSGGPADGSSTSGTRPIFDVGEDDGGAIDCDCGSTLAHSYIWVANSGQSTISKIDTEAAIEVGRYLTRSDAYGDPSRTSVSLSGLAVAVANRNGGVTKVWADVDLCDPMANGTPGLQTSGGGNDVRPWGEDDCIAWSTEFEYTSQRPIAWTAGTTDPSTCEYVGERLWTSGCNKFTDPDITVHRLDGDTGAVLDTVPIDGFPCIDLGGYGGAADGHGNFWVSNHDTQSLLARIDAQTLAVDVYPVPDIVYGITVDHAGRPWLACDSMTCSALRFDPDTELFEAADDHVIHSQSGIVEDADGRMWMNVWWYDDEYIAAVAPIDVETLAVGDYVVTPAQGKGVSVDLDGRVWSVAPQTNSAYRIDPQDGSVTTVSGLSYPYTYSDMTGWALQNATCDPAG